MKRLADFRRFSFVILLVLLTANLWGQSAANLLGEGTKDKPWQITSPADWNAFTTAVNNGYSYTGEYILLENDLTLGSAGDSITTVVGDGGKKFQGTFNGNWKTIHLTMSRRDVRYAAPFGEIQNATIKNLTIDGVIRTNHKNAAGIAAITYGTDSIINCVSSIYINCNDIKTWVSNKPFDCTHGGLVGEIASGGKLYFTNCIFNGNIIDSKKTKTAQKCSGFVGYYGGSTLVYKSCTMAGTISIDNLVGTFHRINGGTFTDEYPSYYISPSHYDTDQGNEIESSDTAPANGIYRKYTVIVSDNTKTYYVPGGEITGLETTTYSYISGQTITIDAPVVSYYGRTLTRGTDYVIKVNEVQVDGAITLSDEGDYDIKIEAKAGSNYGGSKTITIQVVAFNSWAVVKEYLADDSKGDRNITLSANITADVNDETNTALVVNGNVILNLYGRTINRSLVHVNEDHEVVEDRDPDYNGAGMVIIVESGASLTINGPGTITGGFHKGNATYIDGGGIYNLGTLVLNNVSVVGNKVIKRTDGTSEENNFSGRGGGIYSGNTGSLNITGGEIADNEAIGGGGGVYCDRSYPFNMTGVMIKSNISEDKGGGIRVVVSNGKTANLTNCSFIHNCATVNTESKGGGIYYDGQSSNSTLNLVNDTFTANSSFLLGGAIYLHRGTITATNCDMNNNVSFSDEVLFTDEDSYGGAVCLYSNSTYIMDGGSIIGDWSKTNGGGIYIYPNAVLKVKGNVIITNNTQMDFDEEMEPIRSNNNVYLAGAASGDKIQVIGELGPDAVIGLANSDPGTYIAVADGVSLDHILEHIALDNNENQMIINGSGEVEVYVPYPWDDGETWDGTIATITGGSYPPTTSNDVTINRAVKIPSGRVAYAKDITFGTYGSIIIEDGGQLINNNSVAVVAKKEIVAANAAESTGWYLLSSPVTNPNITSATNLITPVSDARYDLYRFNEAAELQWENYKAHSSGASANFTTLENGRGYLYRNEHNHTVDISGGLDVASSVNYTLSYTATVGGNDNIFKGFNIIGNPYSHNIQKGTNTDKVTYAINNGDLLEDGYYVLNSSTGAFVPTADGEIIPPLTGILVQATSASTLTINKVVASGSKGVKADNAEIQFTVSNSDFEDKAFVKFKEGRGLNKIEHLNEAVPMLYIHHNGEDFASVDMNPEAKYFNLNFEAKTTGMYTLSVKPQGEFGYLHLYDKLTEKDIDMLQDGEYSFIGSTADNADRFVVRLGNVDDDENSEIFAYQSGNEIVVSGEGELQVFDVMGRMVMQQHVNGVQTMSTSSLQTGVYILRMGEKTQKIVIK